MKHQNERVHRKVLRKVKKHFVTVTLAGGLVAALGAQTASAEEQAPPVNEGTLETDDGNADGSAEGPVENADANLTETEGSTDDSGLVEGGESDGEGPAEDGGPVAGDDASDDTGADNAGGNVAGDDVTGDDAGDQAGDDLNDDQNDDQTGDDAGDETGDDIGDDAGEGQTDDQTGDDLNDDQNDDSNDDQNLDGQAPELVLPEMPEKPEGTRRATIIHTNDLHGRISRQGESDYDMGLGHIKTIVDAYRELSEEVLLLDAGDTVHGTTPVNLSEGENIIRIMNEMGYKALSPGNHEFNYGFDRLKELEEMANFDFIASNIENESGEALFDAFTEWQVFGENIGIIGVGSQDTRTTTHPNNIVGINFTDEAEAVSAQLEELSDQFSKFIVLSHAGFSVDQEIARLNPQVELIIGGHSHTPVIGGTYVDGNDNTLITQAWEHGKLLGVIHLDFDAEGNIVQKTAQHITLAENFDDILEDLPGNLVGDPADILAVENSYEDPVIAEMLEQIEADLNEELSVVIGESDVHLMGDRDAVRTGETNLGNLITDAVREFTGSEVALVNGGGIRDSIEAGEITLGDVITVLPFINLVETVNIPGSVLLEALEHGMRLYPEQNGALLHVSGMKYIVDATREPGSRVVYAEVGGVELDPDRIYNVATNDFLIAGGDGYAMLEDYEPELVTGELFSDVVIQYIQAQDGVISPQTEGRITISDEALDDEALADLIAEITEGTGEEPGAGQDDDIQDDDVQDDVDQPGEDDLDDSPQPGTPDLGDDLDDEDDLDDSALEELLDALEEAFGDDFVDRLLDSVTAEELVDLVERFRAGDLSKEDLSAVAAEAAKSEDGQTLPDTATAAWLLGLLGLTSLSGGLVLSKKD